MQTNMSGDTGQRSSDLDLLQSTYRTFREEESSDSDADSVPPQPAYYGGGVTNNVAHQEENQFHMGAPDEVIIHRVPEGKTRWSHIDDLDSFFKRVYQYHQKHGFKVMMVQVRGRLFSDF